MHKHDHRKEVNDQQHSPALRSPQSTPGSPLFLRYTSLLGAHLAALGTPKSRDGVFSGFRSLSTCVITPRVFTTDMFMFTQLFQHSALTHSAAKSMLWRRFKSFSISTSPQITCHTSSSAVHQLNRGRHSEGGRGPDWRRMAARQNHSRQSSASVLPQKLQVTSVTTVQRLSDS